MDWTQSMLEVRKLTVMTISPLRSVSSCQGEVLSPLLWCLMVDELLTKLKKSGFNVYGYAYDYVAIVTRGNSLTTLKERMDE